jgi:hypothetical protein
MFNPPIRHDRCGLRMPSIVQVHLSVIPSGCKPNAPAKCPIPKFGFGASLLDFEVAQWQFPTIELQQ